MMKRAVVMPGELDYLQIILTGARESSSSMAVQVQVRRANGPQPHYARAVSTGNNKVLMTSETYHSKSDAVHVANLIAGGGTVVDLT
jgi:uncharacterized protein YegP (UPF0339 family)